jgi:hypothetical protein
MPEFVDVQGAAQALGVVPARVRALIADGALPADKIGNSWLVHWGGVVDRKRAPAMAGRPMSPRNAWALLLDASGEDLPADIDNHARWRIGKSLAHHGLIELDSRLVRRARIHRMWGLPGELRALRSDDAVVLSGSSAAGPLALELAAPDAVDGYVPAGRFDALVREYGLEDSNSARANVVLRSVPDDAWCLSDRRIAPAAAVALDLASYPDSRSSRVGSELIDRLDKQRVGR